MSKSPHMFLSCDWGTSSFRLRLVERSTQEVIAEEISNTGIATVFNHWQQQPDGDRLSFYLTFLQPSIILLEQKTSASLQHLPLLISGMASSSIGMMELPYKEAPFLLDGSDLTVKRLAASPNFPHDVYLVSGVRTADDVMRGEETQVVGCLLKTEQEIGEQVIVLPGTHSKHVLAKDGQVLSFQTYMTGEFFELLSQKSILSNSIESGGSFEVESNHQGFAKGIADSGRFGLLHSSFLVRTAGLFGRMNKQENYYYLSGLLVGAEVRELDSKPGIPVTVVGNDSLMPLYAEAFWLVHGIKIKMVNATAATIKGHCRLYSYLKNG